MVPADHPNADDGTDTHKQDGPTPSKVAKMSCIFECNVHNADLSSPRDRESWDTIVKAAKIRQHEAILTIDASTPDETRS